MLAKAALLSVLSGLTVWESPLALALVAAVPAALIAYYGYRRTAEMDRNAQKTVAAAEKTTARRDTIGEQDTLIGRLQGELERAYERVETMEKRIEKLEGRIAQLENGRTN